MILIATHRIIGMPLLVVQNLFDVDRDLKRSNIEQISPSNIINHHAYLFNLMRLLNASVAPSFSKGG
ncbi:hypothetical protein DID88_006108 [Monilinia fructigena]|uniref:Uncharacterized protein n=1 Tax=Monilinia fructigena TaxID=38457 RepID=A0A395J1N9_9HELO|nr:hypothetical protein DID88_006108 [Monilinia fructigena]